MQEENCFADRPIKFFETYSIFRNITGDIRSKKHCYRYAKDSARISIGVQKDVNRREDTPLTMNLLRFALFPDYYNVKILSKYTEVFCQDSLDNIEYVIDPNYPLEGGCVYAWKIFGLVNDSIFEFTYSHPIKSMDSDFTIYQQNAQLCKKMLQFECN